MSKKDYIKFAAMIKARMNEITEQGQTATNLLDVSVLTGRKAEIFCIANFMADICQDENPRFDRDRFLKACGL